VSPMRDLGDCKLELQTPTLLRLQPRPVQLLEMPHLMRSLDSRVKINIY